MTDEIGCGGDITSLGCAILARADYFQLRQRLRRQLLTRRQSQLNFLSPLHGLSAPDFLGSVRVQDTASDRLCICTICRSLPAIYDPDKRDIRNRLCPEVWVIQTSTAVCRGRQLPRATTNYVITCRELKEWPGNARYLKLI